MRPVRLALLAMMLVGLGMMVAFGGLLLLAGTSEDYSVVFVGSLELPRSRNPAYG